MGGLDTWRGLWLYFSGREFGDSHGRHVLEGVSNNRKMSNKPSPPVMREEGKEARVYSRELVTWIHYFPNQIFELAMGSGLALLELLEVKDYF